MKSDKISKMMNKKVDLSQLKNPGSYPDLYEKVTLELAEEIEYKKSKDYIVVSWESQIEAMDYFNKYGFEKTLDYMLNMKMENKND